MTKIRQWDLRRAPDTLLCSQLAGWDCCPHTTYPLTAPQSPNSLSSTGKRGWLFILFPAKTTKHKQALHKQHHRKQAVSGSVYPRGESILELALPRRGAEVSSVFLPFLSISKGAHVGHSCKAGRQGSQQGRLLEAIMPMITSHYCASPPQRSIMLSIWDVSFDLLTVEQELDQVPCFCSSEALRVLK